VYRKDEKKRIEEELRKLQRLIKIGRGFSRVESANCGVVKSESSRKSCALL